MSDKPYYRISGAGNCPRALSAQRLGYPTEEKPEYVYMAAREGTRQEDWVKEDLIAEGWKIESGGICPICLEKFGDERNGFHVEIEEDRFIFIGHCDGRAYDKMNFKRTLEVKTMSQFQFNKWKAGDFTRFPYYADQISVYMKGEDTTESLYVVKNRSSGYVDKRILGEPPSDYDEIVKRINHIEECVEIGVLAEAEFSEDNPLCEYCAYKELCIPEPKEFNTVAESRLKEASEMWRTGTRMVEEGSELVDKAKGVFHEQTEASGQKLWRYNDLVIRRVNVKGGYSYDKSVLEEMFDKEQLESAVKIKLPYSYEKITDESEEPR